MTIHALFKPFTVTLGNGGVPRPLTSCLLADLEFEVFHWSRQYKEPHFWGKERLLMHPDVLSVYEGLFNLGCYPQQDNVFLYEWRGMWVWTDALCPQGTIFMLGCNSSGTIVDIATKGAAQ